MNTRKTYSTPIEAWPTVKHTGSPGYSARHYAAVSPAADDPLRVAERIAARSDGERIGDKARAMLAEGYTFEEVNEWTAKELRVSGGYRWQHLCHSFDAVIAALESDALAHTPAMRQLIRAAKAAKARSTTLEKT